MTYTSSQLKFSLRRTWSAAGTVALCVGLSFGLSATSILAQSGKSDRDSFVGAWKLLALERPGPDGQVNRSKCCGMFVFSADGHLSVQVMEPKPKAQPAAPGSEQYSQGGYEASYGTYVVDERAHTFIFHVEGALVRTLIGKELPRKYEFTGNQLIVQSTRPDEHWRVIWIRY
jgi:Lipocalin-like domain